MRVLDLQMNSKIQPLQPKKVDQTQNHFPVKDGKTPEFSKVLNEKLKTSQGVNFSSHAMQRIEQRKLNLTAEHMTRLDRGVENLQLKGSQNSLVLMDNNAFIVSVKNKTVVTAIDKTETVNNVYTNIDSVTIV